jgi:LysW-gamma-L-lysine/LysW-L-ornithine aminotransferase
MVDYTLLQKKYVVGTYVNRGLTFVAGEGAYLKDAFGGAYLDLMSSYGVDIFGHGHPAIVARLIGQIRTLTTLHGSFANDTRAEAARALVARCGGGLAQVFLSNSGAEANEAALKFAVLATGRRRFVACLRGYHGKTLGALSMTDGRKYREPFEPLPWAAAFVPYGDAEALAGAVDERTAAFVVEPVLGEGGIVVPAPGYLRRAAEICGAKGALLIVDEIQTGAGRTGDFLASAEEGIAYDILTLGKGLAGGIPIGATLVSRAVADRIPRSSHTSTFGGNPLAAAGILAALDLLDAAMADRVRSLGEQFRAGLRALQSPEIAEVRGRGLMIGVEVRGRRDEILKKLQDERVLAIPAAENVVRFLPPFVIRPADIDRALAALARVLVGPAA